MIRINENFTMLKASYPFSDIAMRVDAFLGADEAVTVQPARTVVQGMGQDGAAQQA